MGYFNFYDVDWENEGKGKFTEEEANEEINYLASLFLENVRMDNWMDFIVYDNATYNLRSVCDFVNPDNDRYIVARLNLCYSNFEDVLEPLEIDYPDIFNYENNTFHWEFIPDVDSKEFRNLSDETLDRITEAVTAVYLELKHQIEFVTTTLPRPEEID